MPGGDEDPDAERPAVVVALLVDESSGETMAMALGGGGDSKPCPGVTFAAPGGALTVRVEDGILTASFKAVVTTAAGGAAPVRFTSRCSLDPTEPPAQGERLAVWILDTPYVLHVFGAANEGAAATAARSGADALPPCTGRVQLRLTQTRERLVPHRHTARCAPGCACGVWMPSDV